MMLRLDHVAKRFGKQAAVEEVDAGAVRIGGRDVSDLAPKDRDVAMVFQNYALYPHMTVEENIGFGLKLRHVAKEEVRRRVREAARILALEPLLDRKPLVFSTFALLAEAARR